MGKHKIARALGVGSGTVARIKAEMATEADYATVDATLGEQPGSLADGGRRLRPRRAKGRDVDVQRAARAAWTQRRTADGAGPTWPRSPHQGDHPEGASARAAPALYKANYRWQPPRAGRPKK